MNEVEAFIVEHIDAYYLRILILFGINIILALGLNLITGVTGQLSMGHAGFMSIGAYTSAILSLHTGAPFWSCLVAGAVVAGMFGVLIGVPTLRLEGDYLAMVTIGFAEIVRVVFLNLDVAGKAIGLSGIPSHTGFVNVWAVALAVIIANWQLLKSRVGIALYAIREDEIAAEASGVNTTLYKIGAFAVGSFLAGIAGCFYAHFITYINPQDFGFMKSIEILNMVVLGGMGSIPGTILGAFVLTLAPEMLRVVQEYRLLFYGALLVIMMIFRPNGLLGDVRWHEIRKRWARKEVKPHGVTEN
ncbi:MAG TPA: branched-chain amino acid ABC transporter permease [Syntrophothermus lipocalidus]|uniref:Inner-membrane translocator n=1 Tax=Syntrophothermus lipocalidus (strain DSM 12680 / TGB-C1) TaxID=643648 RepID=D7CL68_SYNLT|nr:branched-chain amino acid ABC transporter permease [Syntrophothermus lipocalidus]ADI01453.1 inner-membrane translocator [Syntrophothermus lipocalidus DSM 12680]HHV76047.1 branched-chain amino acid ABC transporter permease [Syntrophothermus lipocalidus]